MFFGRDENCDELMRALDNGRLTVLYAESGAGKTSLLKAGLMSRLVARERCAGLPAPATTCRSPCV